MLACMGATISRERPVTPDEMPFSDSPFTIAADATSLSIAPETLSTRFRRMPALVCRDVIDPMLLDRLRARCDASAFVADPVQGIGLREVEAQPVVAATFCVMLQRPAFRRWVEQVTGAPPLATVKGAVAQTWPADGFGLGWHDDDEPGQRGRQIAITIDLSSTPFTGGMFELRRRGGEVIGRFRHDRPGSALIFAVDPSLEHRLLPIAEGGPRRVFAGWFHSAPAAG